MKPEHIIETAKDSSGARVIEAFLASNAAAKQKRRLIIKYALLLYVILFIRLQYPKLKHREYWHSYSFLIMFLLIDDFLTGYVDILASSHYTHRAHSLLRSASMHVTWH